MDLDQSWVYATREGERKKTRTEKTKTPHNSINFGRFWEANNCEEDRTLEPQKCDPHPFLKIMQAIGQG